MQLVRHCFSARPWKKKEVGSVYLFWSLYSKRDFHGILYVDGLESFKADQKVIWSNHSMAMLHKVIGFESQVIRFPLIFCFFATNAKVRFGN